MSCCLKNQNSREEKRIDLGRVGEYGARTITLDLSEFAPYGGGTFTLLHQRANDFDPYTVQNFSVNGNSLVWNVDSKDTEFEGIGFAEVQLLRSGEMLAKSHPYMTYVGSALEISDAPSRGFASENFGVRVGVKHSTVPCGCWKDQEEKRIELGLAGEFGARDVKISLADFKQFGNGTFALIHKRSTDFAPYTVAHYDVDENADYLTWHIDATDTACEGVGYAEIQMIRDGALLAKSGALMTFTESSLGSTETPQAYTQITIDTVAAYAAAAKTYMETAEAHKNAAAVSASYSVHPPIISESNTWLVWDGTQYVDSGLATKGIDGIDAYTYAVEGGYTEDEETFYEDLGNLHTDAATASQAAESASGSASDASDSAEDSEAWAVGTRSGSDVSSSDPTYHNNSKYYAEIADSAKDTAVSSASTASDAKTAAETAQGLAQTAAGNSEAWAVGQRDGTDVSSSDSTYHNNSKYYAEIASTAAASTAGYTEDSEAWAVGQRNGTDVASDDETYHNNSKYYAESAATDASAASTSAGAASSSASTASGHALTSEAWAVGTRGGQDVSISDAAYHNNSKYYAEQAAEEASYSNHPPIIGDNDNWYVWDGTAYEDSGKSSKGEGAAELAGGAAGNILIKSSSTDYDFAWTAPATSAISGSSLPITSGAVYTIIGNIETLLAAI